MSRQWFDSGLRFGCTMCGQCCTGAHDGAIMIDSRDVERISEFLKEDQSEFVGKYTRSYRSGMSLNLVQSQKGPACVFLKDNQCSIYPVRPRQCRSWPFWPRTIATPEAWEKTKASCPGAGRGALVPASEIRRLSASAALSFQV